MVLMLDGDGLRATIRFDGKVRSTIDAVKRKSLVSEPSSR